MHLNNYIEKINVINNRNILVEFLDNNISDIETAFYKSNYNVINSFKFDIADLIFHLDDNNLININDDSPNIRAFIIILSDFYDRFRLKGEINVIYNYIPKCSVKQRLQASIKYLFFRHVDLYNDEFEDIIQLLNNAYVNDDMGYRAKISLINYFLTAKENLSNVYPEKFIIFKNKFNLNKNKYQILDDKNIQSLISIGAKVNATNLLNNTEELHRNVVNDNISINLSLVSPNKIIESEKNDYSDKYNRLNTKSFSSIQKLCRQYCGRSNNENHLKLKRGTAVIDEEELLYQYIISYGNMHKAKLNQSINELPWHEIDNQSVNIIDWGCGQALGTVILYDYILSKEYEIDIEKVILIEPSLLALKRGLTHIKPFNFNEIKTINKDLDSLYNNDLQFNDNNSVIHIFSNILDVPFFDLKTLCNRIDESLIKPNSKNYFICVSPNIDDFESNGISIACNSVISLLFISAIILIFF